jgi:hypothetical protein
MIVGFSLPIFVIGLKLTRFENEIMVKPRIACLKTYPLECQAGAPWAAPVPMAVLPHDLPRETGVPFRLIMH